MQSLGMRKEIIRKENKNYEEKKRQKRRKRKNNINSWFEEPRLEKIKITEEELENKINEIKERASDIKEMNNILYFGERNIKFRECIENALRLGNLKDKYINLLLNRESMRIYGKAFTHSSINERENYEVLEQMGDTTVNKILVWYFYRRFPQLDQPKGVKIVARLRINYASKDHFAEFGKQLGFWRFISAEKTIRENKMRPLLEDVFEAFFGATEKIIDENIREGVGYSICYNILKNFLDKKEISLKYEDLFDAKTRLKELFDFYPELGKIKYTSERKEKIQYVKLLRVFHQEENGNLYEKQEQLVTESASLKIIAEQKAAERALKYFASKGFKREIPKSYMLD